MMLRSHHLVNILHSEAQNVNDISPAHIEQLVHVQFGMYSTAGWSRHDMIDSQHTGTGNH